MKHRFTLPSFILGIALACIIAFDVTTVVLFFASLVAGGALGGLLGASADLWRARKKEAAIFVAAQVCAAVVFSAAFFAMQSDTTAPSLPQQSFITGCAEINGTRWHAHPSVDCAEELARRRCENNPEDVLSEFGTPQFPDLASACELYVEIERARIS